MHKHALATSPRYDAILVFSQGRLDSQLSFLLFLRSCGRRGWFCILGAAFPSARCAIQQSGELTTLGLSASCGEGPYSNQSYSPLRQELPPSPPPCRACHVVLELNLHDQSQFHKMSRTVPAPLCRVSDLMKRLRDRILQFAVSWL